jgi:hypothetical protein
VELSWKLRPASSALEDKFVECKPGRPGTGEVTEMRLDWEVRSDAGVRAGFRAWKCGYNHGVTGFELPEGDALLTVTPICGGVDAHRASYIAPAPEQRRVIAGDTISLGAVEIIVVVTDCGSEPSDPRQHCICE